MVSRRVVQKHTMESKRTAAVERYHRVHRNEVWKVLMWAKGMSVRLK